MQGFSLERPVVIHALVFSSIITFIFVALITILADLVVSGTAHPIKDWLAETHGHHWVGKGIWTMVLFAVLGFVSYLSLKLKHSGVSERLIYWSGHIAAIAAFSIVAFFIYEYLHLLK